MKQIKNVVDFETSLYLKSSRLVMPLVLLVAYCIFAYNQKGCEVVGSMNLSAIFTFYIMVWIGLGYQEVWDDTSEQLLILRLKSDRKYYISQEIVLLRISVILSAITVAYPTISHVLNGFGLFEQKYIFGSLAVGLLLHIATAFAGAMCGSFFHKRIFRDRKMSLCILMVIIVVAIAKNFIKKQIILSAYILWIFPPVDEFIRTFREKLYFSVKDVTYASIIMVLYGVVLMVIKNCILIKRKF